MFFAKLDTYAFTIKSTTFVHSYLNKRMQIVNFIDKVRASEDIYSGVPQVSILVPLFFNIFIIEIIRFFTACSMCNYAAGNTVYTFIRYFHQFSKYFWKDLEILENLFYGNYKVIHPCKSEFMSFGKNNEKEVFTYHEIQNCKKVFF